MIKGAVIRFSSSALLTSRWRSMARPKSVLNWRKVPSRDGYSRKGSKQIPQGRVCGQVKHACTAWVRHTQAYHTKVHKTPQLCQTVLHLQRASTRAHTHAPLAPMQTHYASSH